MTWPAKGDLVWVSGSGWRTKRVTAEQVAVVKAGDSFVNVDRPTNSAQNRIRLPRSGVFPSSDDAVLAARGELRLEAARLEQRARELREIADAEPEITPADR